MIKAVQSDCRSRPYIEIATANRGKLEEFRRLLRGYEVVGKNLDIEEIQSLDPYKVARFKSIAAYKANGSAPILVEETSLALRGLGGRPGTYIKDFAEDVEMRRMIAETWLKGRDRTALAKVVIAVFDGSETQFYEGHTEGAIADGLRGTNGFGWDDLFIPKGDTRTFAEMSAAEKDRYSMRRKALMALCRSPFQFG